LLLAVLKFPFRLQRYMFSVFRGKRCLYWRLLDFDIVSCCRLTPKFWRNTFPLFCFGKWQILSNLMHVLFRQTQNYQSVVVWIASWGSWPVLTLKCSQ
jgi:hypothetical protein